MRILKGGIAAMAVAALVAMPAPVAAKPDKEDIARALAALAILGVAVAKAKNDPDGWDEDRYGDPFSPAQGVICLPKPKQCFKDGHFSYRWTRRIFGI
ncbi:hypothetical protein [Tabrizicola flagellatus]|uniref:hypothetical protein n=1 Tax=Tabrizicola flagellatus TaxID=2593021 RepID=UPI0011F2C6C4|nr:hypothetical protein [Tabrizicola flagellatus]